MADDSKEFLAAIPDGFFDMIGKVAAGSVAIVTYKWDDLPELARGNYITVVLVFGLLILAWVIGLFLEGVGYGFYPIRLLLQKSKTKWKSKWIREKLTCFL